MARTDPHGYGGAVLARGYDPELEGRCKAWIEGVIGRAITGPTFREALSDGVALCDLVNALRPGAVKKVHRNPILAFRRENYTQFQKASVAIGVAERDTSSYEDVADNRSMGMFLSHIVALARVVQERPDWKGPILQDARKAPRPSVGSPAAPAPAARAGSQPSSAAASASSLPPPAPVVEEPPPVAIPAGLGGVVQKGDVVEGPAERTQRTVLIPATVRRIEGGSFLGCGDLEELWFDNNSRLEAIGERAFANCGKLKALKAPASLRLIEGGTHGAFSSCPALAEIVFPGKGLQSIGDWCFYRAVSLTAVTLPAPLGIIGAGAFFGCASLASVQVPTVVKFGDWAFADCEALKELRVAKKASVGAGAWPRGCKIVRF